MYARDSGSSFISSCIIFPFASHNCQRLLISILLSFSLKLCVVKFYLIDGFKMGKQKIVSLSHNSNPYHLLLVFGLIIIIVLCWRDRNKNTFVTFLNDYEIYIEIYRLWNFMTLLYSRVRGLQLREEYWWLPWKLMSARVHLYWWYRDVFLWMSG